MIFFFTLLNGGMTLCKHTVLTEVMHALKTHHAVGFNSQAAYYLKVYFCPFQMNAHIQL